MSLNANLFTFPSTLPGMTEVQTKLNPGKYVARGSSIGATEPAVILGEGQLNWNRAERVTDRYGNVGLYNDADWMAGEMSIPLAARLESGSFGRLQAVILETREADHVGDLTHGWKPGGAVVGEVVILGEGRLFFEHDLGDKVGVAPTDGRRTLWLDGPSLYKCHSQTVRLEFVPASQK